MLPFIKRKNDRTTASLLIQDRNLSEKPEEFQEDNDPSAAIEACASLLINAVHAHDVKAAADAICDAFEILESLPHEENNVEPHSYQAQNIKAAEEY